MNTDKRVFFLGFRSGVAEDSVLVEELAWNVRNRLPNYATSYLRTESPSIASAVQTNDLSRGATLQNSNAITQNAGKTPGCWRRLLWELLDQPPYCLGRWSNTSEVADSTIMGNWKWLFVNDCEWKRPISTATEFLKSFEDGQRHQYARRFTEDQKCFSGIKEL